MVIRDSRPRGKTDTNRIKQRSENDKQEEYAERYRTELALYDRAERYLKEHLGSDTKLKPKAWKAEVADLTAQKDRLYREMRSLKEEVAEAETVKRCIEQTIPPTEQRKEKSKTHDVSLWSSRLCGIISLSQTATNQNFAVQRRNK